MYCVKGLRQQTTIKFLILIENTNLRGEHISAPGYTRDWRSKYSLSTGHIPVGLITRLGKHSEPQSKSEMARITY
jgi:hypothetical protein